MDCKNNQFEININNSDFFNMDSNQQQQQQQQQAHQQLAQQQQAQQQSNIINLNEQDGSISQSNQYSITNNNEKKATHSEIEKRRRQKMNKHLNELVHHLPLSMNKNKKPDKITILKMAVQHMKNLKASSSILSDSFLCQNYITPFELQSLVLKEAEEFLIIVKCDSSKILYVSESCSNCIGFSSSELVDKVFFEFVHPSDSKQVKDQLAYYDNNNTLGTVNNFILNNSKSYSSGDRRSFMCRIRTGLLQSNDTNRRLYSNYGSIQDHLYTSAEVKKPEYRVVNFVGYLRSDLSTNLKYNIELPTSSVNMSPSLTNSNESSLLNTSLSSSSSPSSNTKLNNFTNYHSITLLSDNLTSNPNLIKSTSKPNDSFFNSNSQNQNESNQNNNLNNTTTTITNNNNNSNSNNISLQYYLIAYGQIKPQTEESVLYKFISRHDLDGKFVYIEPSVYTLIGYLPNQLLSDSIFNLVHTDDVSLLKKAFQETVNNSKCKIRTHEYRFKLENNTYINVESVLFALQNPFNQQLEYIVAQNSVRSSSPINLGNQNTKQKIPNTNHQFNNYSQQQCQQSSQQYLQQTNLNSNQAISMPMTPSPEESIFNNDNTTNSEKFINNNSNINLNDLNNDQIKKNQNYFTQTSPNSIYNRTNLNQLQSINSSNLNPVTNQKFNNNSQLPGANNNLNLIQQKQSINNYNMFNNNSNKSQQSNNNNNQNLYQLINDNNSLASTFINSDEANNCFDQKQYCSPIQQQQQQQQQQNQVQPSTSSNAEDWMIQLFENTDSDQNNFKKS